MKFHCDKEKNDLFGYTTGLIGIYVKVRHYVLLQSKVIRSVPMLVSNPFYEASYICISLIPSILSSDSFQDLFPIHSF